MKNDSNTHRISITEDTGVPNSVLSKFNEIKVNMLESVLTYFTKLNSINEDMISNKGAKQYCNIVEELINDITKFADEISSSSLKEEIKRKLELQSFEYRNSYTFNITECINRIDELKNKISSLNKEKEALYKENKQLKTLNLSIESDISKQSDIQSFSSISSDNQDIKSMYEMGYNNNNSVKNSKLSRLTNSAIRIIRSTSSKRLLKDKKSRSRGFSVSLPVKRN